MLSCSERHSLRRPVPGVDENRTPASRNDSLRDHVGLEHAFATLTRIPINISSNDAIPRLGRVFRTQRPGRAVWRSHRLPILVFLTEYVRLSLPWSHSRLKVPGHSLTGTCLLELSAFEHGSEMDLHPGNPLMNITVQRVQRGT